MSQPSEDTVRALLEHLENYCNFPTGPVEERLSRELYAELDADAGVIAANKLTRAQLVEAARETQALND